METENFLLITGRSNRSTSLALIEYIEEISNSIDNKNVTIGVSIDLKKAFDTIDHGILIKKLDCCGIRGIAKTWLQSYLQNRFQYVEFGNSKSELLKINCDLHHDVVSLKFLFQFMNRFLLQIQVYFTKK